MPLSVTPCCEQISTLSDGPCDKLRHISVCRLIKDVTYLLVVAVPTAALPLPREIQPLFGLPVPQAAQPREEGR